MAAVIVHDFVMKNPGGNILKFRIQRGTNNQTAFIKRFFAKVVVYLTADFLAEIFGIFQKTAAAFNGRQRLFFGRCGLFLRNIAFFGHAVQHPVAATDSGLVFAFRMIVVRTFGQRRQIGDFFNVQLIERLAEVIQRGGGHAVRTVAQINFIQIKLKDMVFAERVLNAGGKNRFLNLAGIGKLGRKQHVFGHLLGNGRSAGGTPAAADVFDVAEQRADNADIVNAAVRIEIFVFGGDESVFNLFGNFVDRNEKTFLGSIFHQQPAVAGIKPRGYRRFIFFKLMIVGKFAGIFPQAADNDNKADYRKEKERTQQRRQCFKHQKAPEKLFNFLR